MRVHFIESGQEGPADKVTFEWTSEVVSLKDPRGRMFQAEERVEPQDKTVPY